VVEPHAGVEEVNFHQELCDWIDPKIRGRCTVREVVRKGTAAEQIAAEAKDSQADLIVLGAHPRSFVGTILFGSTTELVIRNAPCPVLSVIRK
jgi:nucleotide-binding universal stress UspA family protein